MRPSTPLVALTIATLASLHAQARPPFQDDFPAAEFVQRRALVMDAIVADAIAIVPGAAGVDGRTRRATLYPTLRNEALGRSTGSNGVS